MSSRVPVRPVGWRILVEPVEIKRQTAGGIVLAEEAVKAQEYLRYIGKVLEVGPLAYGDTKFREHPNREAHSWCKAGDHIAFGRHAGQEVVVNTADGRKKLRVINDDEVLAVIDDPAAIVIEY